jgi:hypothetical protein
LAVIKWDGGKRLDAKTIKKQHFKTTAYFLMKLIKPVSDVSDIWYIYDIE